MIIKSFGNFIMKGRKQAIIIVLLCSGLPFMNWLSSVVIGFVTLRKGAKEGLLVLLWASLISVAFLVSGYLKPGMINGYWMPFVINILCGSFLVWILAVLLRGYSSWRLVIEIATAIGIVGVVLVSLKFPELNSLIAQGIKQTAKGLHLTNALNLQIELAINAISQYSLEFIAVNIVLIVLFELAMSRGFQALLYNPGGLRKELLTIRLNFITVIILAVCLFGVFLELSMVKGLLFILMLPFIIAGTSLAHWYLDFKKTSKGITVLFYLLLLIFPWFLLLLAVAAILDSIINIRERAS